MDAPLAGPTAHAMQRWHESSTLPLHEVSAGITHDDSDLSLGYHLPSEAGRGGSLPLRSMFYAAVIQQTSLLLDMYLYSPKLETSRL